ncbi:hypothetical protein FBZ89_10653 [Nitrospirillum amazonense]|uniref:Uncharacterized protein n=1 Tax=Nitrospirillum amazonense TaxID=28077 RepID=A0A560FGD0_9PROT|nr:hypothetical protein [Nitrospirillum amazonense]TWB20654.1 hypothetical protein FBZ89_10653 [Nitrospirillum amazonense]
MTTPASASTVTASGARKAPSRRRAGRPRKAGVRHACGQLVQAADAAILPQALERRADLLGAPVSLPMAQLLDQRAGQPLGQLLLRGRLTQRQHDAGQAVGGLWRAWLSLAEAPKPHAYVPESGSGVARPDIDPDRWARTDDRLAQARALIRASGPHGLLALTLVESLCADEVMPRRFEATWAGDWPQGWAALTTALDALADHYRIPRN